MSARQQQLPAHSAMSSSTITLARDPERQVLARRAKTLAWLSLAWMTVEGAVGITAAVIAGSVALLGFGLDSVIEGLSATILLWLLTGSRVASAQAERRAQKLVAVSFFLLAPYLAYDAISTLITHSHPSTSWVGIGLSASSLLVMPVLGRAKKLVGRQLGSLATVAEGSQADLCALIAGAVLIGLGANLLFGLWWLDPALGLVGLSGADGRGGMKMAGDRRPLGWCVASAEGARSASRLV